LARFIGDLLNAAENSFDDIARSSFAIVHAFIPASTARGTKGESSGSSFANLTFQGRRMGIWRYLPVLRYHSVRVPKP
jgi:hypothetical protein